MFKLKTKYNVLTQSKPKSFVLSTALCHKLAGHNIKTLNMKNKIILIYFLFLTSISFAQEIEFKDGIVITNKLDTLKVKLQVLNEPRSILRVKYLNKKGKIKKILTKNIISYKRGDEFFKTITITKHYKLFCKQIINGKNVSLYERTEGEDGPVRTYMNVGFNNASPIFSSSGGLMVTYFIENKYGRAIGISGSPRQFKNRVADFLLQYPSISEKIRSGELSDINEIVDLCNQLE